MEMPAAVASVLILPVMPFTAAHRNREKDPVQAKANIIAGPIHPRR